MLRSSIKCCYRRSITRSFSLARPNNNQGSSQVPDDILANFAKNTASKQDSDTFTSIFNNIMTFKKDTSHSSKNDLPSLQVIFEKNLYSGGAKTLSVNESKDLRSLPLSLSGDIVAQEFSPSGALIQQIQTKHELKEAISPTLQHLNKIDTDYFLIKYIESLIKEFSKYINSKNYKYEPISTELITKIKERSETDPNSPLINEFTIPIFLSTSINLLCLRFNSPLEAISIFQHIKNNLDIKTYTFSCTTEVYNEILERSWQFFRDPYMIDSLINEMKVNGISGDMDTISILGLVTNDMEKTLLGTTATELEDERQLGTTGYYGQFWNSEDEKLMKNAKAFRTDLMTSM